MSSCLGCGLLTQAYSLIIEVMRFAALFWIGVLFGMQQWALRRGCTTDEGHCEGWSWKRSLKWRRLGADSCDTDAGAAVAKAHVLH